MGKLKKNAKSVSVKRKRGFASFFVRLRFSIQMALHGVFSNPLRSLLTLLGIAIGVASVVSLMGIGEGTRMSVMEQFESLGQNVVVIEATEDEYEFLPDRAAEFVERVNSIDMASPIITGEAMVRWRRIRENVGVMGVNQSFPAIRDHDITAGHFFNELHIETRAQVVVLGYNVAMSLLYGRNPVGNTITIGGLDYVIIGVMAQKGAGQADGVDDMLILPYTTAQKLLGAKTAAKIICKTADNIGADLAIVQLSRIFRRELGLSDDAPISDINKGGIPIEENPGQEGSDPVDGGGEMPVIDLPVIDLPVDIIYNNFSGQEVSFGFLGAMGMMGGRIQLSPSPIAPTSPSEGSSGGNGSSSLTSNKMPVSITSLNQMVEEADQANRVMTLLLGAIAAVSLLVGGLGIMNIMLVAVTERIGEIGVRRALGAKQGDLMWQFILEALFLSGLGALLGVVLGLFVLAASVTYGFSAVISISAIQVAVGVALGCGLIFGVYPAFSASSVSPVEALRRN